jgi:outer membrane protein TolC
MLGLGIRSIVFGAGRPLFGAVVAMTALGGCSVTPSPLDPAEIASFSQDKLARVDAGQEPVGRSVDLYEAMARALKYNLDARVAAYEQLLRIEESKLTGYDMLPKLVGSAGYNGRDNDHGSSSRSLLTGLTSLVPSTSQERETFVTDLTFSWNILDFGLSYVRARQSADRALIAGELRRKMINRVIEDVRTAYWRALAAQRLVSRLRALEVRVVNAQRAARNLRATGQTSPVTALTFERELLDIQREIRRLETELVAAKVQLAALMNVRPGTPFAVVEPYRGAWALALPGTSAEMIRAAMLNRPELREAAYQKRIAAEEATAALLELLPGINLFLGANYDTNTFLFNNNWVAWGARASWNVMNLFRYPQRAAVVEANEKMLDEKALAITMAILTQVHASRLKFVYHARELATHERYLSVQRSLLQQIRREVSAGTASEQTLLREEMNTLVAEVKRDISYANWQNAFANLYASIGLDPYPQNLDLAQPVPTITASLRQVWSARGHRRVAAAN